MIKDGENVEKNSSEEIESPGIYICWTHAHIIEIIHIFINLVIYLICKIIM